MKTTRTGSNEVLQRLLQQLIGQTAPAVARTNPTRQGTRTQDGFDAGTQPVSARQVTRSWDGSVPAPGTTEPRQWIATTPPVKGDPANRNPDTYANVINQFAVGVNGRYVPQGNDTYCNIFASDVMQAMNAPLPHWVTSSGAPSQAGVEGAHELNANDTNLWLNQQGGRYGWREIGPDEAQSLANQGYPVVVSYNSGDASPGHIAVVRPGSANGNGPEIAQAGGTNTNDTHVGNTFGDKPVQYFVCDGGAAKGSGSRRQAPSSSTPAPSAPTPSAPAQGSGASAPAADCQFDGGVSYDPNVEQLQRTLVETGYMTQAEMDTGPGYYGPRTRAAVARLQAENGIVDDGTHYGPQTRAALTRTLQGGGAPSATPGASSRSPAPSPAGSPSTPAGDGSLRRWNVPYISQMHSAGGADDWNASSNCGPTTVAMIAKGLGYGGSTVDGDLINQLCQSAGVGAAGTGYDGVQTMAKSCGLSTQVKNTPTADWVKQQLQDGKLVAANGDRAVTLRNEQPPYASGQLTGGHWIAVVGMTKDGNFLVQDPSTTCKVLSPGQLESFFRAHGDGGWAVAIGNGQQGNTQGAPPAGGRTANPSAPATGNSGGSAGVPQADCVFDGGVNYDPNVEQLQRSLVQAGYLTQAQMDTGPGYYGPRTRAAVAQLQQDNGIVDDGTHYGPQTRAALSSALGSQPANPGARRPAPAGPQAPTGSSTVDGVKLSAQDAETAKKVDAFLQRYPNSHMQGMGAVLVDACRKEHVPLDLVLAQLGKEATFLSDGSSVPNHNAGNLRFASWESAFGGVPGQGGFTAFPSVEQGIRAYVHLLGSPTYRSFVDQRDWAGLVHVYAPASDGNDEATYVRELESWSAQFADAVGIDQNWVNEP